MTKFRPVFPDDSFLYFFIFFGEVMGSAQCSVLCLQTTQETCRMHICLSLTHMGLQENLYRIIS